MSGIEKPVRPKKSIRERILNRGTVLYKDLPTEKLKVILSNLMDMRKRSRTMGSQAKVDEYNGKINAVKKALQGRTDG